MRKTLIISAAFLIVAVGAFYLLHTRPQPYRSIHEAACSGEPKDVQRFLERGAKVEERVDNGLTPLQCAAIEGNRRTAEYLVSRGAKVDLFVAAGIGDVKVGQSLLYKGANINESFDSLGTPLHWAARNGHLNMVRLLVESGARLDVVNRDKDSPLHLASEHGHDDIALYLASEGMDVNRKNRRLQTPLHLAAMSNHVDAANALIKRGAKIDLKDDCGCTPLFWAVSAKGIYGDPSAMVRLLISNGADPEVKNNKGETALSEAEEYGRDDLIKIMQSNKGL